MFLILGESQETIKGSFQFAGKICEQESALSMTLHKKWHFPLRISSVNVTKSAVSCGFGHIYWRNP